MKKIFKFGPALACAFGLLSWSYLWAGNIALVYENEQAVRDGHSITGTVTAEGVLIPAQVALKSASTLMVAAVKEPLRKGVIVRLDNTLDMALIKLGDFVSNPELQKAHEARSNAILAFLPEASSVKSTTPAAIPVVSEPFIIKINGQSVGTEPIWLIQKRREVALNLDVVNTSTTPAWNIEVNMRSNPPVSFWKKGDQKGLNAVPQKDLTYSQQFLFHPLSPGESVTVPIELSFIKTDAATLFVDVKTKADSLSKQIPVKFE